MIARAQRPFTTSAAATPDAGAVNRSRLAEGEIDHDPDSCPCNADVFGEGPCRDCRRVFDARRVQQEETALAQRLGPMPIDYALRWRLFLALPDDN